LLGPKLTSYFEEPLFTLSYYVDNKNFSHWRGENPHDVHEITLDDLKGDVGYAISVRGIAAPQLFNYYYYYIIIGGVRLIP
jgi:hypothetical protein